MKRDDCCVYCHTVPSGRRYVGISCSPKRRWRHGKGYEKNYLFWRAITKYGWENIDHDILYDGLTIEEAAKIEKKLIAEWNLTNPEYGMNLSGGGDGILADSSRKMMSESRKGNTNRVGRKLSQTTRTRISDSLKKYYKTHPNPMQGKHLSEEAKQKLRERAVSSETREKMRKNHADVSGESNPSSKAVAQLSLNGEFIKKYTYATAASIECNIDLSAIIKCCKGKVKSAGGFKWIYSNGEPGVYGWKEA